MEYFKVTFSPKEHKRIFSKIIIDPRTECWNWTGSVDTQGYGLVWYKKRTERTHRVLYSFITEPIPRGVKNRRQHQLDHLCKNKGCCNPKHLELVSQRTNVLRGEGPSAVNSRKTHCKNGHPLPPNGRRDCRICDSVRHKKRMEGPQREYWLKKANEATKRFYWKNKR